MIFAVKLQQYLLKIAVKLQQLLSKTAVMLPQNPEQSSYYFAINLRPLVQTVIRSLRATEVQMLKARLAATARPYSPPTTLIHIVDIIRNNPDLFQEWHSSKVKDLFTPPIYENKKDEKGYWFQFRNIAEYL